MGQHHQPHHSSTTPNAGLRAMFGGHTVFHPATHTGQHPATHTGTHFPTVHAHHTMTHLGLPHGHGDPTHSGHTGGIPTTPLPHVLVVPPNLAVHPAVHTGLGIRQGL